MALSSPVCVEDRTSDQIANHLVANLAGSTASPDQHANPSSKKHSKNWLVLFALSHCHCSLGSAKGHSQPKDPSLTADLLVQKLLRKSP